MCGIAGFVSESIEQPDAVLRAMLAPISRRGPDDHGFWHHNNVGLAQARLSILDLSQRGHQPFVTDDGTGVLIFNGEVYNYQQLRDSLRKEGIVFHSETDTEVVLHALHQWGPMRAVPAFNGMFAFAYYDLRDQSLWLARDKVGIKPLFFYRKGRTFAFASEQKALFEHPDVTCQLDTHSLLSLLLYERFDGPMTPYQGIEVLPPGVLLRIKDDQHTQTTYFDVLQEIDPLQICRQKKQSFPDQLAQFESLLAQSVKMHLVSDAPVATMCSGGVDSSLVTSFAAEHLPNLVAYVADIEGMGRQEVTRAQLVADALGIELRPISVDRKVYFDTLPEAIAANDQPLFFSQCVAANVVAKAIRADGFKVVLSGDGADELFGGYRWYVEAYRYWRNMQWRANWVPNTPLTRALGRRLPSLRPVNIDEEITDYFTQGYPINYISNTKNMLFVAGAARSLRPWHLFKKLEGLPLAERGFLAASFEDFYVQMREYLNSGDKMTMHHSIEERVPFFENQLIRFGLDLPISAKYHGGVTKHIVRSLAHKRLPKEIINMPKIGFNVAPSMWKGTSAFLRNGRVAELLKWPDKDQDEIISLVQGRPYYQFRLLSSEVWLRTRFEGECPEQISATLQKMTQNNHTFSGER